MKSTYLDIVQRMDKAYTDFGVLLSRETRILDEFNLTAQQESILSYINTHHHTTANEIAADFNITKSAVSQTLSKLEKKNMIKKTKNPANKREYYLELGPEGNKYINYLDELIQQMTDKYYSKIPVEELDEMVTTMEKINSIIREEKAKS
ncbi:MarR family transcriptional regulator [Bacillus sp. AGMB 02131]|uniref:MarR family transcriptional regulator n=1 Tax=Peribacillus faecalis TaxID=2772559 RepID=A0A927HB01_9BACI|nr:MarR family transcriptional regulator [Peribacillus faecalis]MBD3109235.1 MarR family transcriptional regulator [Peribacillus faecalis]